MSERVSGYLKIDPQRLTAEVLLEGLLQGALVPVIDDKQCLRGLVKRARHTDLLAHPDFTLGVWCGPAQHLGFGSLR